MSDIFSKRLKNIREQRKMSQYDLAEKTGLLPAAISHFETGNRSPSFENLKKLSEALQVSADYLMGREDIKLQGETIKALFRDLNKLSDQDLNYIKMMAETMRSKNKDSKK